MGRVWKVAGTFGGLAVTVFIAHTQLPVESLFDPALLIISLVFAGLFTVMGIIYIALLVNHYFRPLDILDDIRCTYWSKEKQIRVESWFRDHSNSPISEFSCIAEFEKQTVDVNGRRNTNGSYLVMSNASYGRSRPVMVEFSKDNIAIEKPNKAIITVSMKPEGLWATKKIKRKVAVLVISH